jgi:hypothetical protein
MVFSLDGSLNSLAERLCLGVTIGDGEVMAFRDRSSAIDLSCYETATGRE